jgi:hypothetical protein
MDLHRAPPSNLTGGFNWSLCCGGWRICKERNGTREGMAKAAGGKGHREIASKEEL